MKKSIHKTDIHSKLQAKLKQKQLILLDILNERYKLQNEILPNVIYKYEILFAEQENELLLNNLEAEKYEKIIDRIIVKAKRGEKIGLAEINKIEKDIIRKSEAREQKQLFSDYENPEDRFRKSIASRHENRDNTLIKIFRQLAKQLHPDTAGTESEYLKYWHLVLDAYNNKDITRMKIYNNIINKKKDEVNLSADLFDDFCKNISQIMRRIEFEARKNKRIMNEEPFTFISQIDDMEWIEERRDDLVQKINSVKSEIMRLKSLLEQIKKGDYFELTNNEDMQFQEKFSSNTYFKSR